MECRLLDGPWAAEHLAAQRGGEESGLAGLGLVLKADKETTYGQGEPIKLTLHVINRGTEPATLHFLVRSATMSP